MKQVQPTYPELEADSSKKQHENDHIVADNELQGELQLDEFDLYFSPKTRQVENGK